MGSFCRLRLPLQPDLVSLPPKSFAELEVEYIDGPTGGEQKEEALPAPKCQVEKEGGWQRVERGPKADANWKKKKSTEDTSGHLGRMASKTR